jgi:hypothetical protein
MHPLARVSAARLAAPTQKHYFAPAVALSVAAPGLQTTGARMRIFISYRRSDSSILTDWLDERLKSSFGPDNVFRDSTSLDGGDRFPDVLKDQIEKCNVFLVIIGDQWLNVRGKSGQRRLDEPDDYVRNEIEIALSRKIRIIPVLAGIATMPAPEQLPPSIRDLALHHGIPVKPLNADEMALIATIQKTKIASDELAPEVPEDDDRRSNPILSEFDHVPLLGRFARWRHAGFCLPLFFAAWSILALVFARLANAHCIHQVFAQGRIVVSDVYLGYWVELNHGVYHVLGVTIFCGVSAYFLMHAQHAIKELSHSKNARLFLVADGQRVNPTEHIATINRRIFRVLFPLSLLAAGLLIYHSEARTFDENHVGWVQAARFGDRWAQYAGRPITEIPFEMPKALEAKKKENDSSIVLQSSQRGDTPEPKGYRFGTTFLVLALGHQIAFYTLAFWMAGKIFLFFFVLLQAFLRTGSTRPRGIHLRLKFDDHEQRFGLRALDAVYDSVLIMVLIAVIGVFLQWDNNFKATASSVQTQGGVGRMVSGGLPGGIILCIAVLPMAWFRVLVNGVWTRHILQLIDAAERAEVAGNTRSADEIRAKISLAREQRTWPRNDRLFVALMVIIVVSVPLGIIGRTSIEKLLSDFRAYLYTLG